MSKQRKSSVGDIRIIMPEGKPARRPARRIGWMVGIGMLVVVVLTVLWRLFANRA